MSFLSRSDDAAWNENYMQKEIDGLKQKIALLEAEIERSDDFIAALEEGGLDNWDGLDDALIGYNEKYQI